MRFCKILLRFDRFPVAKAARALGPVDLALNEPDPRAARLWRRRADSVVSGGREAIGSAIGRSSHLEDGHGCAHRVLAGEAAGRSAAGLARLPTDDVRHFRTSAGVEKDVAWTG